MRALTLKPEWAELVLDGSKRIENRSWGEHGKLAGKRIAIHRGGQGGAIICTVVIKAIVPEDIAYDLFPKQREHICGPLCWILGDKIDVEPATCRGQLGLWEIPRGIKLIPLTTKGVM